ncbi:gliding motility-associated C-terminal domain-containing protein, partial [bacterium]|nr:gliding motility-associated C-terminal domain-containing protein [bacterium]
ATHSTDCGTVADSILVVEVPCGCAVFAPSGFTPDGDLINDAWRPVFECEPEEYSLKIFDRWGGLVWQSQNPEEYWTGGARADGRPLDEKLFFVRDGIYAFQVTYRDPTSLVRKIIRKTGHIKILR